MGSRRTFARSTVQLDPLEVLLVLELFLEVLVPLKQLVVFLLSLFALLAFGSLDSLAKGGHLVLLLGD